METRRPEPFLTPPSEASTTTSDESQDSDADSDADSLGQLDQWDIPAAGRIYVRPTDDALMRREFIGECRFQKGPYWRSWKNPASPCERFKKHDYLNRTVHVIYPDGTSSRTMRIPNVAVGLEEELFFRKQRALIGVSMADFVQPMRRRLQKGCEIDRIEFEEMWDPRNTDARWWTRHKDTVDNAFGLIGAEPSPGTREWNGSMWTVTCSMMLTAVVLIGEKPDANTLWRPALSVHSIEAQKPCDQGIMPAPRIRQLAFSQTIYERELEQGAEQKLPRPVKWKPQVQEPVSPSLRPIQGKSPARTTMMEVVEKLERL